MGNLSSKAHIRGILARHEIFPKKNYGQNFLVDGHVLERIMTAADLSADDAVIEIGPGLGVLTAEAASRAGFVTAIEIDSRLIPILQENLINFDNIRIINQDILKTDIAEFIEPGKSVKILANLPYYITTPIIFQLLESQIPIKSMIIMVQREVARRMMASPKSKDYSALTVNLAYYAKCSLVANVPSNCFFPRPDVDSAVIKLDIHENPPIDTNNSANLFATIRAAFSMRRKTLENCLSHGLGISKTAAAAAILSAGFSPTIRGEEMSLEDYGILVKHIYD